MANVRHQQDAKMNKIIYQVISPFRADVRVLVDRLNAHHLSHCPPEICHLTTAEQLAETDYLMIGAFNDKILCGIGAIKFMKSYGEITRMFVDEQFRGHGIAKRILEFLLERAVERNLKSVKLETSEKFTSAVRLYKSYGFTPCAPFGEYVYAPHNTYMEKNLAVK